MLLGISTHNLELFLGLGSYRQWYKPQRNLLQWSEDLTKGVWLAGLATVIDADTVSFQADVSARLEQALSAYVGYIATMECEVKGSGLFGLKLGSNYSTTFSATSSWVEYVHTGEITGGGYVGISNGDANSKTLDIRNCRVNIGTSPSTYQKTEDFQTVTDFSGKGRDAQNGSTTGEDTNDADLRQPWSRNVMPVGYVNDLTNWTCSSGCTVVDSDTVTLDPGASISFWPDQVANTYSVFSATVNVTSGGGTLQLGANNIQTASNSVFASSGRLSANRGGRANIQSAFFTGTGINDMSINTGTNFSCAADYLESYHAKVAQYVVEIDATGTPDTFKWSHDGGSTWEAAGVAITGAAQTLDCGVQVTFANTTGHTLGDTWTSNVYYAYSYIKANPFNSTTITVDIANPQVEYCEDINCTPTPFTDPRMESVVAGAVFETDDYVDLSSLSLSGDWTFIAAVKADAFPTPLWSNGGSTPKVTLDSSGKVSYTGGSSVTATNPATLLDWHIIAVRNDGGAITHFIDGVANGSGSSATGNAWTALRIGTDGTTYFDGNFALLGAYSRALGDQEAGRASKHMARQLWNWRGACAEGYWTDVCGSTPLYASLTDRELNNLLLAQSLQVFDLTRLFRQMEVMQ